MEKNRTISVVIPTFNEEDNILDIYGCITEIFERELNDYDYLIQFIDNCSRDSTRQKILDLCNLDSHVQAIFNATNFGFDRSVFWGLTQSEGNCAILLFADMQDPPCKIIEFVREWENGFKIVLGIKNKSKERHLIYSLRELYYRWMKKVSDIDHITQFDGFGLYDRSFIEVLKGMDDSLPYLRGIIAELGYEKKYVYYEQEKRKKGKSNFNLMAIYDLAMLGITSYTKNIMHMCTILGVSLAFVCILIAIVTVVMKLISWNSFSFGMAAMITGNFFLGAVQLTFIGFVGEYIVNINIRTMKHPLVVEEMRINFRSDYNHRFYNEVANKESGK